MRKSLAIAAALTAIALPALQAHAVITPSVSVAPNFLKGNTANIDPTLAAQGWAAYIITLTADSTSGTVSAVDLKEDLQHRGGPIGIFGRLHQDAEISSDDGVTRISTPSTQFKLGSAATRQGRDSVFLNIHYFWGGIPAVEDNNFANGTNPPNTQSPLTDVPADLQNFIPGHDFGVGSLMTMSGASLVADQQKSIVLAYIILPYGEIAHMRGYALDPQNNAFFFDQIIGPIPEPASLGILAFGGVSLLFRRQPRSADLNIARFSEDITSHTFPSCVKCSMAIIDSR
jgi:hypothetical protein